MLVAEVPYLLLDAGPQRAEQPPDIDADLDVVRPNADVSGGPRPSKAEDVAVPRVGPAEIVVQAPGHQIGQPRRLRQPQTMAPPDEDLAHRTAGRSARCDGRSP